MRPLAERQADAKARAKNGVRMSDEMTEYFAQCPHCCGTYRSERYLTAWLWAWLHHLRCYVLRIDL
jgi:hypothetical protein